MQPNKFDIQCTLRVKAGAHSSLVKDFERRMALARKVLAARRIASEVTPQNIIMLIHLGLKRSRVE